MLKKKKNTLYKQSKVQLKTLRDEDKNFHSIGHNDSLPDIYAIKYYTRP